MTSGTPPRQVAVVSAGRVGDLVRALCAGENMTGGFADAGVKLARPQEETVSSGPPRDAGRMADVVPASRYNTAGREGRHTTTIAG